jgi:hypothetical protein
MRNYTHTLAQIGKDKRIELQDLIPGGNWPSDGAHGPTAEQTWTGAFEGVMPRSSLWTNAAARDAKRKRRAEAVRTRHVDESLQTTERQFDDEDQPHVVLANGCCPLREVIVFRLQNIKCG